MSDQVPLNVQNNFPSDSGASGFQQGNYTQPQFNPFAQESQTTTQAEESGQSTGQSESLADLDAEARKLRELSSQMDSLQQLQQQPQSAFGAGQNDSTFGTAQNENTFGTQNEGQESQPRDAPVDDAAKTEADARSIYVGNVDYGSTPVELQQHFSPAGSVERITILTNKHTGQPKGFAYVEFASAEEAQQAVASLDGSQFRDRELKVSLKRTNVPGISSTNRGRGRGRGRGFMRGRVRGFRGRGRGRFAPY